MRVILGMRQIAVIFGILALALGGCSTLSGGLRSDSALLAASSASSGETAATASPAAEPTSAAIPAESKTDTSMAVKLDTDQMSAPTLAFAPVSFEPIKAEDSPAVMVAFLGPLFTQRGTPAPPVDAAIEEYDPWEPFNEKMFKFNKDFLDNYVLKPVAKGYNFIMPDMFQQMIDNGFSNIKVVQFVVNNLLQGRLDRRQHGGGPLPHQQHPRHRRPLRHRQAGIQSPEDQDRFRPDVRRVGVRARALPGPAFPAAAHGARRDRHGRGRGHGPAELRTFPSSGTGLG